jgi:AraC family transcriptional regulator, regulatory protein of adaptative response / DNA-3-methyladenine glycosylase II
MSPSKSRSAKEPQSHRILHQSPPSPERASAAGVERAPRGGFELPLREPFDWQGLLAFLGTRAIPGVEHVHQDAYWRTLRVAGAPTVLCVSRRSAGRAGVPVLAVTAWPAPAGMKRALRARVAHVFDLGADPARVLAALGRDPLVGASVRAVPGLRVPGAWDGFELGVRAVLGQQVTVAGARTLAARLVARHGVPLPGPIAASLASRGDAPALTHLFPEPGALATANLDGMGLTGARIETLHTLAAATARGELLLEPGADWEEARRRLLALRGIGPWTADYVAMRALGEHDAFPAADLGIRNALARMHGAPCSTRQAELASLAWRPFRSYAVMHLWRSLSAGARPTPPARASRR